LSDEPVPGSGTTERDRRRIERVPVFEVYEVIQPTEKLKVIVRDMNHLGMQLVSDRPLEPHSVMLVQINYSPLDFPLRALVVWTRPTADGKCEAGLEFLNVASDEAALLNAHIEVIGEALQRQREGG